MIKRYINVLLSHFSKALIYVKLNTQVLHRCDVTLSSLYLNG